MQTAVLLRGKAQYAGRKPEHCLLLSNATQHCAELHGYELLQKTLQNLRREISGESSDVGARYFCMYSPEPLR